MTEKELVSIILKTKRMKITAAREIAQAILRWAEGHYG